MDLGWVDFITDWIRTKFWGQMEGSGWIYLPDTVLIEIYTYLEDKDRANAAITCKNWLRVFHTPSLWRKRSIELGGFAAEKAGINACCFADQHGKYLQHLKLCCNHPSNHTCKIVQKNIEEFCEKIKFCRLVTFEFSRLELDRFWKYEYLREKVVDSLCRLLKPQKYMEEFDMCNAQCSLTSGCKILDILGNASGDVLKTLSIEDFFHSRLAMFQVKRFRLCMKRYTHLNDISLNYNCLSDDILEILSKNLAGKLTRMLIKVHRGDPHFHRISRRSWKQLTSSCPGLSVEIWFECVGFASEVIPILVPEMPLQDMHLWTGYNDDMDWNLPDIINHLGTHYKKTLHSLSLELDNTDEFIDDALLRMLAKCTCLHELTMNAAMHVFTVETICNMQLERKIIYLEPEQLHKTIIDFDDRKCNDMTLAYDCHNAPIALGAGPVGTIRQSFTSASSDSVWLEGFRVGRVELPKRHVPTRIHRKEHGLPVEYRSHD